MSGTHNPYADLDDAQYQAVVDGDYIKSAYSGSQGCVALTGVGEFIGLQDDKLDPEARRARTQVFTKHEMAAFVQSAKDGEFDHLL